MHEQSIGTDGNVGSDDGTIVGNSGPVDTAGTAPVDSVAGGKRGGGGWPKGRPRKPAGSGSDGVPSGSGSSNRGSARSGTQAKEKAPLDLSGIENALIGIHIGIATLTSNEIWTLQPAEAKSAAQAVKNVARHYPNLAGHEKLVDWVMLIQTLGMMYGPRLYLSIPEKTKKKPATPPQDAGYVLPFPVPRPEI